jgi:predicted metal-dependent phosphoesterase TrpH
MRNLPFRQPGRFFKGNLHTHSTRSDGALEPEAVVATYRERGYDFLALTDHFLAPFDFPLTDTRAFRDANFTTLLGAELHAPETEHGEFWHLLAVGLPLDFAPTQPEETGPALAARAAEAGAFVGIAHPAWYTLTLADAISIEVAHAVETYNTVSLKRREPSSSSSD